jgi:hypothetical protein
MPTNLEGKIVRRKAGATPPPSPEELARLRDMPDEQIDYSDIPEQTGERQRMIRDQDGRFPPRRSAIRETVAAAMTAKGMTAYALTKAAKAYSPTISETAVGAFLKGTRSIGLEYLEAILDALGLTVVDSSTISLPIQGTGVDLVSEAMRLIEEQDPGAMKFIGEAIEETMRARNQNRVG